MLALILRARGWQPSFVIGGEVNEVGTNAAYDDGEWLVVEADESDGTFLELGPEAAIVTNVEPDHLDHYGGFDALVAAFERFVDGGARPGRVLRRRPGRGAPRAPRPGVAHLRLVDDDADYRVDRVRGRPATAAASRSSAGGERARRASICRSRAGTTRRTRRARPALALELGVPFDAVVDALGGFGGVARRFEYRGEARRRHVRSTTTRTCRARSRRDDRAPRARAGGGASSPCSSRTATRAPQRCGATSPTRSSTPTRVVLTDVYPAGEAPIARACRAGWSLHAVLDAPPGAAGRVPARAAADLVRHALRPRPPRRRRADARRRRPHDAARRVARRRRRRRCRGAPADRSGRRERDREPRARGRTTVDLDAVAAELDASVPGAVARRLAVAELTTYRLRRAGRGRRPRPARRRPRRASPGVVARAPPARCS